MNFIDTHTHLYTEEYDADRSAVVQRAIEAGAQALLLPAIDETTLPAMWALCREFPDVCRPMIGLHPTELPAPDQLVPTLDRLEALLAENAMDYVAVGECGLDFYWDRSRAEEQQVAFERQIAWAEHYGLSLMIHSRSAHRELVNTLLPHADRICGGVFHCFSGSREEAQELLQRFPHFRLGIGGVLTFKNCHLAETLEAVVPIERIVLETDAPYLAPVPHRGTRNESAYVPLIIERLSQIYSLTPEEVADITTRNAQSTFSL